MVPNTKWDEQDCLDEARVPHDSQSHSGHVLASHTSPDRFATATRTCPTRAPSLPHSEQPGAPNEPQSPPRSPGRCGAGSTCGCARAAPEAPTPTPLPLQLRPRRAPPQPPPLRPPPPSQRSLDDASSTRDFTSMRQQGQFRVVKGTMLKETSSVKHFFRDPSSEFDI